MSRYLARLKEAENKKILSNTQITELPKLTEAPFGGFVSTTQAQIKKNILLIQSWLYQIDEPEEDHYLVIDKCNLDSEVMEYFLKHACSEWETE